MIGDHERYREARVLVEQAYVREAEAIRSSRILAENDAKSVARIDDLAKTFAETGRTADLARLDAYAKATLGSVDNTLTSDEAMAAKLVPKAKTDAGGGRGGRGGGGGGGGRGGAGAGGQAPLIAGTGASEARIFADGKRSILDIRDAVSAEFGPQDAGKFIQFFRDAEKAGQFEIVQR
jgi:hypothetical protein